MTRIRNAISFSNVIAFIALFVALGGSVYAAGKASKINGQRIKPNSIPGNRLKASSVAKKQLKAKSVSAGKIAPKTIGGGKIKPNSLGDTQIKASSLTGVTAAAIGAVYYVSNTVRRDSGFGPPTNGAAACPPATYVIGGGATVGNDESSFVNDVGPNGPHTGMEATLFGSSGSTMTITAICTAVAAIG
jgi:hypothetical protein